MFNWTVPLKETLLDIVCIILADRLKAWQDLPKQSKGERAVLAKGAMNRNSYDVWGRWSGEEEWRGHQELQEAGLNGLQGVKVWTWPEGKRRTTVISFSSQGVIQEIICLTSKFWRTGNNIPGKNVFYYLTLSNTFPHFLTPEDWKILFWFDFNLFFLYFNFIRVQLIYNVVLVSITAK